MKKKKTQKKIVHVKPLNILSKEEMKKITGGDDSIYANCRIGFDTLGGSGSGGCASNCSNTTGSSPCDGCYAGSFCIPCTTGNSCIPCSTGSECIACISGSYCNYCHGGSSCNPCGGSNHAFI